MEEILTTSTAHLLFNATFIFWHNNSTAYAFHATFVFKTTYESFRFCRIISGILAQTFGMITEKAILAEQKILFLCVTYFTSIMTISIFFNSFSFEGTHKRFIYNILLRFPRWFFIAFPFNVIKYIALSLLHLKYFFNFINVLIIAGHMAHEEAFHGVKFEKFFKISGKLFFPIEFSFNLSSSGA